MTEGSEQPGQPAAAPAKVQSAALLCGARKVLIEHEGDIYTLQVTRQGKLLLTK